MMFNLILAFIFLILPLFNFFVAWKIREMSKLNGHDNVALYERGTSAFIIAIASVLGTFLGLNRLLVWGIERNILTFVILIFLVLLSFSSIRWIWMYYTGKFDAN